MRLRIARFGPRRALDPAQQVLAAQTFGAERDYLSSRKKLLDTRHSKYRRVTHQLGLARTVWRQMTVPFPEASIRLIRRNRIAEFELRMSEIRGELTEALHELEETYAVLRTDARERLGELFNADDYPASISGEFGFAWDFPSVEPPNYLKDLNPELYEQEQERVRARFDEAIRMAEEAFTGELSTLVNRLAGRLDGTEDGKPKVLRESAVENLREFFERFSSLNVRSNAELEQLVEQARQAIDGVDASDLRGSADLRRTVGERLTAISEQLEGMTVDRPTRRFYLPASRDAESATEAGEASAEEGG